MSGVDKGSKRATPQTPLWLTKAPEPGWRYKVIGTMALVFGVAGGFLGWRLHGNPISNFTYTLWLAMLMPAYFTIPRTKTQRMWQGVAAGVLGGLVDIVVLLLFATGTYWPYKMELLVTFAGLLLVVIAWSWMMTWITGKTEQRKLELDERKASREAEKAKEQAKAAVKLDANGKPIRVHRYNRKPGRR